MRRGGRDGLPSLSTPEALPASGTSAYFLGHSLLGFEIPNVVQRFADETGGISLDRDVGIGIGANLQYQWNNPGTTGGDNPSTFLQANSYDALVLTEAVPIENQVVAASSVTNALNFANYAYAENAAVQVYLYETWEDRTDVANWRESVDERRTYYDTIYTGFNTTFAGSDMRIIPGGQAVGALVDAVLATEITDLTDPDDLFVVEVGYDIHPTDLLIYYLGCVHYACIFQTSPVGRSASILDRFDGAYTTEPTAGMAADMQALAWKVVQAEPYSGVAAISGVPTFDSMSPASMSIDFAVDGAIEVTFSEDMNPATIYGDTLPLSAGGVAVLSSYAIAGSPSVATITPNSDLTGETLYTVSATEGIQDFGGTYMEANRAMSFTTEVALVPPELNTTSPLANATGASRFANINIYYFQDIDATTVDDTTFIITETAGGTSLPGVRSVSGGTITFNQDPHLTTLTEYRVQLTAGVTGTVRGAVVPLDYTFTTG